MSDGNPLIHFDYVKTLQIFRDITNATNERTFMANYIPQRAVGHTASIIHYRCGRAVASALVLANMNSIPFDWAVRLSMGGMHLNFFIVKQLPALHPEAYLEKISTGITCVELIIPRVLELTYTSTELKEFAKDLGYNGPPFIWDDNRRHCLKCELDAIFAHMYQLERSDLEWILDAPYPGSSFPTLKKNEIKILGEYRTKRYILHAYDQLKCGELPDLKDVSP